MAAIEQKIADAAARSPAPHALIRSVATRTITLVAAAGWLGPAAVLSWQPKAMPVSQAIRHDLFFPRS